MAMPALLRPLTLSRVRTTLKEVRRCRTSAVWWEGMGVARVRGVDRCNMAIVCVG
jgi:hypothetical protein